MSSKRQEIVDAIIERLKTVAAVEERVEDWRTDWDDDELPAMSVCDLIAAGSSARNQGLQHRTLPVQIRIFAKTPAELRQLISDALAALKTDLYFKDADDRARVTETRLTKEGMVVPADAFELGGAAVEIEIDYFTANFSA